MDYTLVKEFDVGWQYQNAINLRTIIKNRENFAQENVIGLFKKLENSLNLNTCDEFWLIVWGIILGERFSNSVDCSNSFLLDRNTLDNAMMCDESGWTQKEKRIILKLKYRKITLPANLTTLEESLQMIDSSLKVQDNRDMTLMVYSEGFLSDFTNEIIRSRRLLNIPAGVGVVYNIGYGRRLYADGAGLDIYTLGE